MIPPTYKLIVVSEQGNELDDASIVADIEVDYVSMNSRLTLANLQHSATDGAVPPLPTLVYKQ